MFGKRPSADHMVVPRDDDEATPPGSDTPQLPAAPPATTAVVSVKPDRPEASGTQRRGQSLLASALGRPAFR